MCGIILFMSKHKKDVLDLVLKSLYNLQNRGYDSFGVCYKTDPGFDVYKKSKTCINGDDDLFDIFHDSTKELNINSHIIYGHSRWATHGSVNYENTHPHVSNCEKFFCVHNGIIENHKELKLMLENEGYVFYSNTDTEVIINLVEYFHNICHNIQHSIYQTICLLKGTYGLVISSNYEENVVYLAKNGSPLIVSENDDCFMASSELCGLHSPTNYFNVENNDIVKISLESGIEPMSKVAYDNIDVPQNIDKYVNQDLGIYNSYTEKEIMQQDETLMMTLNNGGRIKDNTINLGGLSHLKNKIQNINNIILLGCGSSYYAACIGKEYIKEFNTSINVFCHDGGDFDYYADNPQGLNLYVFISQSGETMDLMKHLKIIKDNHDTMGIINVVSSSIASSVDCGIYMNIGKEVAVASTKSFTSSILILKLFSLWLYKEKTNIKQDDLLYGVITNTISGIQEMIYQVKTFNYHINMTLEQIIMSTLNQEHLYILGKRTLKYLACEAALKFKEICYIHGEGMSSSELKHGPLALIHRGFPVILLIDHENIEKMVITYKELECRHAQIFIITSYQNIRQYVDTSTPCIFVPENSYTGEILFILCLQHICLYISTMKNINPDKPRNLAKVVTVE